MDNRILQPARLSVSRNLFKIGAFGDPGEVVNYDRYIPTRTNNNWETNFAMLPDSTRGKSPGKKSRENGNSESPRDNSAYNCLLRNELLGETIEDVKLQCDERQALTPVKNRNLFSYGSSAAKVRFPYLHFII